MMRVATSLPDGSEPFLWIVAALALVIAAAVVWLPGAVLIWFGGWGIHRLLTPEPLRLRHWHPISAIVTVALWTVLIIAAGASIAVGLVEGG
ncbi:hypothetical protein [Demequina sp. NBRC 110055]|uniref:hypothetical protein n=1 Tax=Demequina sp. NBRC 110055 TaxID=1570344 RepID=UPI0011862D63|nr:hypothetical protein [Demequina sp. NBRC 110055]